ncbi:unnamed protein product [Phaedon cochleariae]|uniref:Ninjurin-1 n=1 Tax=Phaedon cochleariae TaxID=80249 RepID=A0A9P0DGG0_PHACE|nr:unnamed protein product [Phaedon cochleariae]
MDNSNRVGENGCVIVDISDDDDRSAKLDGLRGSSSTISAVNEDIIGKTYVAENFAKQTTRRKSTDSDNGKESDSDKDREDDESGKEETRGKERKEDFDEADGPRRKKSTYEEPDDVPMVTDIDATEEQALKKPSNSYAAKKTVAQGMMDIALITANANQLRYMVEFNRQSPTYYFTLILISVSLFLQVVIGMALIIKGRLDIRGRSKNALAKSINNYVIIGVFLVTIINVFIASFTVTVSSSSVSAVKVTTLPTVGG